MTMVINPKKCNNFSLVLVTHNPELANRTKRIIKLNAGKILSEKRIAKSQRLILKNRKSTEVTLKH